MNPREILKRHAPFLALVALWSFYMAMRPLGIHVSDSYAWVNTVEKGARDYFYHPHHLLYLPMGWLWTRAVQFALPSVSTWCALAALSAAFGCAGVSAMYAILRLIGAGARAAMTGAALLAFSFGYWFFSSDAEVYTVSASFALWALYFLARYVVDGSGRAALWAGAAAGFAALFHQTGIFLFVPAAIIIVACGKTRGLVAPMALFTGAFGALVAPAYIVAAWAVLPTLTIGSFVRWLLLFGGEGYGGWSVARTSGAPIGLGRAIIGGQLVLDWLRGGASGGMILWVGLFFGCGGMAAFVILAVKSLRRIRELAFEARTIALGALGAFLAYAVFAAYFDPLNFEWWTIPAAILAVAIMVPALASKRAAVAAAFVCVLFVGTANLILDFSYRRRPDCDLVSNAAARVIEITNDNDVIIAPPYLGVLIWRKAPGRTVFCPEEVRRIRGEKGQMIALEETAGRAGRGAVRIVIAGAESDAETARFVKRFLASVPADKVDVAGDMLFFSGRRGLVEKVDRVAILAVWRPSFVIASGS